MTSRATSVRTTPAASRAVLLPALLAALSAACGDSTSPERPVDRVAVSGVSIDPAAFRTSGAFALGVVPTSADGSVLLGEGVRIEAAITSVRATAAQPRGYRVLASMAAAQAQSYAITIVSRKPEPAGSRPLAAALDIDNSGSMSGSDPRLVRRSASKLFWDAVLGARATNQVALADFGHGRTAGFRDTRLLQGWGRDTVALKQRLDSMTASGGTPLYESALEMLRWIDSTRAQGGYERVMVLMTDGQPSSDALRDSVASLARARAIRIHTVGLGDASDLDAGSSVGAAVVRVRELAFRTGGVYAAASSAAALDTIFQTMAKVSSAGQFLTSFRITPVPPTGTVVTGTVTVTAGGNTREAVWSIVAP